MNHTEILQLIETALAREEHPIDGVTWQTQEDGSEYLEVTTEDGDEFHVWVNEA